ncbi:MAG: FAD binding domain-containing protein, partial [Chloroflexi bacterium]|nr:FAD binding domain-containing protein [Chloroflexota bacterium]
MAPESLAEACSLLSRHGEEAKIIAGGQSLIPLLQQRLIAPTVLVDIKGFDQLA